MDCKYWLTKSKKTGGASQVNDGWMVVLVDGWLWWWVDGGGGWMVVMGGWWWWWVDGGGRGRWMQ